MTPIEIDLQDRHYLQRLRNDAFDLGQNVIDQGWRTAYMELAQAADTLDAMLARNSVIQSEGRHLNIGTEAGVAPTCECGAPDCECDKHSGCCGDRNEN